MFIVQITLNFDKNRTSFFNWTHFIGFQLFFPADGRKQPIFDGPHCIQLTGIIWWRKLWPIGQTLHNSTRSSRGGFYAIYATIHHDPLLGAEYDLWFRSRTRALNRWNLCAENCNWPQTRPNCKNAVRKNNTEKDPVRLQSKRPNIRLFPFLINHSLCD